VASLRPENGRTEGTKPGVQKLAADATRGEGEGGVGGECEEGRGDNGGQTRSAYLEARFGTLLFVFDRVIRHIPGSSGTGLGRKRWEVGKTLSVCFKEPERHSH